MDIAGVKSAFQADPTAERHCVLCGEWSSEGPLCKACALRAAASQRRAELFWDEV